VRIENGIAPVPVNVVTTASTVRELLAQNNIRLGPNDEVIPALNTRLTDGMVVLVNRAMIVFITSNGQMTQLYMTGGTVEDALAKANISYDQDDEVTPALDTKLSAGIRIKHVAVEKVIIMEMHSIEYSTNYQNDPTLLKGKTKVLQSGSQGTQSIQIEVTYRDGVEISRVEISNTVIKEAKSRIVLQGTGSAPRPTSTPASGDSAYSDLYKDVTHDDCIIPPIPSQFETILYMQITAYTHTGRRTACGNWPQYTRTLKKPGTIAVDPKAIPYGTLLYVTGYGYCVAEDTGSNTVDSSRMGDVFMNTKAECNNWGRRRNVTVYVVQYNYKTKWN
jgi:3D (Asp-Asp-Asp) domain-containing protein